MTLRNRVTVDVDRKPGWRLKALKAWHELRRCCTEVEVRVSASGRGLHIIGYVHEDDPVEDVGAMRRYLGDDPDRLHLDYDVRERVGHMTNVCWTEKQGREADTDFSTVEDAIAAIE